MQKSSLIIALLMSIILFGIEDLSYGMSDAQALKKAKPHFTTLLTREEALKFIFDNIKYTEKKVNLDEDTREELEEEMRMKFDLRYDKSFDFFIGKKGNDIVRYAVIFSVPGKWGEIKMMMGITPEGKVYDLAVMSYSEIRGKPAKKRIFLNQYKGKSIKSKLKVKRDIHGISGATITSRGITNGVKRMLFVYNSVFLEEDEDD